MSKNAATHRPAGTGCTFEFDGEQYREVSAHQQEWGKQLIAEHSLRGDERILDVGCGDGRLTAKLADCVPRGHVVGIDSSIGMLRSTQSIERANLSFTLLDVTEAKFYEEFDIVFSNAALHWVKDHAELMQILHRALNARGVMRVNFGADGNCQTWFRLARQLMETEFRDDFVGFEWPYYMPAVDDYARVLDESPFSTARVWGTNADRFFPNEEAMLGWLAQPAIVPFKHYLDEDTAERFHKRVASLLIKEAKREDGRCFETFRRIEVSARK